MTTAHDAWMLAGQAAARQLVELGHHAGGKSAEAGMPPLLLSVKDGRTQVFLISGKDIERDAKRIVAMEKPDRWALAADTRMHVGDEVRDALMVEAGAGESLGRIAIPYTLPLALGRPIVLAPEHEVALGGLRAGLRNPDSLWAMPAAVDAWLADESPAETPDMTVPSAPLTAWTAAQVAALSPKDRLALQSVPLLAFLLVAASDGEVSAQEMATFARSLSVAGRDEVMAALFPGDPSVILAILRAVAKSGKPAEIMVGSLGIATRCVARGEARNAYAASVRKLARQVAEASGGWFGIFGSKISKEEQHVLDALDELLAQVMKA